MIIILYFHMVIERKAKKRFYNVRGESVTCHRRGAPHICVMSHILAGLGEIVFVDCSVDGPPVNTPAAVPPWLLPMSYPLPTAYCLRFTSRLLDLVPGT
jgi:hypothetical protein